MTTRTWTYAVLLAVAPAVAFAPSSRALAAVAPSVAEREAKAAAFFEDGKHAEAIAVFEALYAERSSPNYLYNIARIQEDAGDLEGALENYEKFVGSPGVELEMRAAASDRARTIRGILESAQTDEPEETPTPVPLVKDDTDSEPRTEVPPPRVVAKGNDDGEEDEGPREGPTVLGTTGYVFLGTGVVALAAGGVVGGLATQDQSRLTQEGPVTDSKGLQEAGKRKAVAADVLFAVGGTLAAAGLTMVIVDAVRRKKRRARASAAGPRFTVSAGGEGMMFGLGGRL